MSFQIPSHLKKIQAYLPPLSGRRDFNGLRLDFNERTIPICEPVANALTALAKNPIEYPEYDALAAALARYNQVPSNWVLATNGSDQAIDAIFRLAITPGDKVILSGPTFPIFEQCVQVQNATLVSVPLKPKTLEYDTESVLSAITTDVKLIVICNPNNPTGSWVTTDVIRKIATSAPHAIILVDEAYFEFSEITAIPLIETLPNVVVTRTFSKAFGLAALRAGYIIANPDMISNLGKIIGPYAVNMMATVGMITSITHISDMQTYRNAVMNEAKPLVESFFKSKEIPFWPSKANFILFLPPTGHEFAKKMAEKGILIRPRTGIYIDSTCRISIGTPEQMRTAISVMDGLL